MAAVGVDVGVWEGRVLPAPVRVDVGVWEGRVFLVPVGVDFCERLGVSEGNDAAFAGE